jgi:hypothetical protein
VRDRQDRQVGILHVEEEMGSNSMKYRLNSQSGTLCRTFNLLTKLVLKWEIHVSLKFSIMEHYEPKGKKKHRNGKTQTLFKNSTCLTIYVRGPS